MFFPLPAIFFVILTINWLGVKEEEEMDDAGG